MLNQELLITCRIFTFITKTTPLSMRLTHSSQSAALCHCDNNV